MYNTYWGNYIYEIKESQIIKILVVVEYFLMNGMSIKIEQKTIIAELKDNEEALIEIGKAYLENVKIDTEEIFYKYCTEKYLRIKDKVFVIDHISGFDPRD